MSKSYTWKGANGGSWDAATNWDDGSGHSTGFPGAQDFAEFLAFDGKVTGAVDADILDVGPGSSLTLDGSGFFSQINVGQDVNFAFGAATLTIAAGQVVSAALLDLGTPLGGAETLKVAGTFSTSGGIVADQAPVADTIVVGNGGAVDDGANLTMADGGRIQVGKSGRMVIGSASGGGTDGALTIDKTFTFFGEGAIAAKVVDNGTLETFHADYPANKLTVTGKLSGSGKVLVVQELDLNGAVGAGVKISLLSNGGANAGLLRLAHAHQDKGVLTTMSTHSVIALTGLKFSHVHWASGELIVTGASGTLKLKTSGDHSHQTFAVKPDAISGTDIVVTGTKPAAAMSNAASDAGFSLPSGDDWIAQAAQDRFVCSSPQALLDGGIWGAGATDPLGLSAPTA